MKKRSKIYTDEKSIIAAIDSKKSELIGLAERAEQLDANKKKHYKNHYDLSVKAESLKGKKQKDCEDEATEQKKLAHDLRGLRPEGDEAPQAHQRNHTTETLAGIGGIQNRHHDQHHGQLSRCRCGMTT